jgi:hypothetical protein
MFLKLIRQMIFVSQMFYIMASEYCLYFINKDYSSFIDRLTLKLASINILYVKVFQAISFNINLIFF